MKATEKAFKAAHDRLLEELKVMGLSFGYDTRTEYPIGPDRLDVAWVNRSTMAVEVAMEVELGKNPTGELWKLVELRPKLAVLAVKGKQYDQTLMRIAKSRILRDEAQTLMILDVTDKRVVVIHGNDIMKTQQGIRLGRRPILGLKSGLVAARHFRFMSSLPQHGYCVELGQR